MAADLLTRSTEEIVAPKPKRVPSPTGRSDSSPEIWPSELLVSVASLCVLVEEDQQDEEACREIRDIMFQPNVARPVRHRISVRPRLAPARTHGNPVIQDMRFAYRRMASRAKHITSQDLQRTNSRSLPRRWTFL